MIIKDLLRDLKRKIDNIQKDIDNVGHGKLDVVTKVYATEMVEDLLELYREYRKTYRELNPREFE